MRNKEIIRPHSQGEAQLKDLVTRRNPRYNLGVGSYWLYMCGSTHIYNHVGVIPVQTSTLSMQAATSVRHTHTSTHVTACMCSVARVRTCQCIRPRSRGHAREICAPPARDPPTSTPTTHDRYNNFKPIAWMTTN